jgi:hypothetical protein
MKLEGYEADVRGSNGKKEATKLHMVVTDHVMTSPANHCSCASQDDYQFFEQDRTQRSLQ